MAEYYLDIETTGTDPSYDKIITVQYQRLSSDGTPFGDLVILKEWELSERKIIAILKTILIGDNPWNFIPVGNNLLFDFALIRHRLNAFFGICFDIEFLMQKPYLDLKPILVVMNNGQFKEYDKMLGKAMDGSQVPKWYTNKEYETIVNYVKMEANSFIRIYQKLKKELPKINQM